MPAKILMIEDESGLVLTVGDRLVPEGYLFESSSDGIEGEAAASAGGWDLILLDFPYANRCAKRASTRPS